MPAAKESPRQLAPWDTFHCTQLAKHSYLAAIVYQVGLAMLKLAANCDILCFYWYIASKNYGFRKIFYADLKEKHDKKQRVQCLRV